MTYNQDRQSRLYDATAKAEIEIASALLKTREGRLFFALLIEESGFLKNGLRDSPEQTAFAEGERSIGGRVFNLILSCPNGELQPLQCMNEYKNWHKQIFEHEVLQIKKAEREEE